MTVSHKMRIEFMIVHRALCFKEKLNKHNKENNKREVEKGKVT